MIVRRSVPGVVVGARRGVPYQQTADSPTTSAMATLVVGSDGVVRRIGTRRTVRYRSGGRVITRSVRFEDVGTTTVERPAWVANAVDA